MLNHAYFVFFTRKGSGNANGYVVYMLIVYLFGVTFLYIHWSYKFTVLNFIT